MESVVEVVEIANYVVEKTNDDVSTTYLEEVQQIMDFFTRESGVVEHYDDVVEAVEKISMLDEEVVYVRFFIVYSLDSVATVEVLATSMVLVTN